MSWTNSRGRCSENGCSGRYYLHHLTGQRLRAWKCSVCGLVREEFRKALEFNVERAALIGSSTLEVPQLAELVLDDQITLSQIDAGIRDRVEGLVVDLLARQDRFEP